MTLVAKILLFLQVVVICAALGAVLAFVGLMIFGNLAGASNMEGALTMVSAPTKGGTISTRTFIPHRCHASIGVLGAVSVATACLIEGTPAHQLAAIPEGASKTMPIEHPIGETTIVANMADGEVKSAAILRTANKLMDGDVFA